jgi:hypothetical protein
VAAARNRSAAGVIDGQVGRNDHHRGQSGAGQQPADGQHMSAKSTLISRSWEALIDDLDLRIAELTVQVKRPGRRPPLYPAAGHRAGHRLDQHLHHRLRDRRHRPLRVGGPALRLHRPLSRVRRSDGVDARRARLQVPALGAVRSRAERLQAPLPRRAPPALGLTSGGSGTADAIATASRNDHRHRQPDLLQRDDCRQRPRYMDTSSGPASPGSRLAGSRGRREAPRWHGLAARE